MTTVTVTPAVLMLEDGTCFVGTSSGAQGEAIGEMSFNTAMIGYPEVISDPANAGQIVAMTYPQVGNYGIASADLESERPALSGLVLRDLCPTPSNYRLDQSLPDYLIAQGVVTLTGVDTRAIMHHLREQGAMRAIISTVDGDPASLLEKLSGAPKQSEQNLVAAVSCQKPYLFEMSAEHLAWHGPLPQPSYKLIVVDLGVTRSTLNYLSRLGCAMIVVPWDTSAQEILAYEPHGVLLAGGPGDPRVLSGTIAAASGLVGKLPVMGVGLGHLVLALAAGGKVGKLKVGHRGSNYPVMALSEGKVFITTQNHGYAVRFETLGEISLVQGRSAVAANPSLGRIQLTEANLNDNTVEALLYLDVPALSVQYHPEAAPGPISGPTPYSPFIQMMAGVAPAAAATETESEAANA